MFQIKSNFPCASENVYRNLIKVKIRAKNNTKMEIV